MEKMNIENRNIDNPIHPTSEDRGLSWGFFVKTPELIEIEDKIVKEFGELMEEYTK